MPGNAEEELARQVMPSIVELQKILVEGARNALGERTERAAEFSLSLTSCDHHSCGGGGHPR